MPVPTVLRCTMQQIWKNGRMRSLGHHGVAACIAATGFTALGGGPYAAAFVASSGTITGTKLSTHI
ncbi:hypothetical protein IG631_16984 [Alternaria alternata]|nr:hypothetical protein IG631_16984 [Alternaria alternata]